MEREIPLYTLGRRPYRGDDLLTEAPGAVAAPSRRVDGRRQLRLGRSKPIEGVCGR
jgi:hypothetical protein